MDEASSANNTDEIPVKRVCLAGEFVDLPADIWSNVDILCGLVNNKVWESLSTEAKQHLTRFLPKISDQDVGPLLTDMADLGKNFHFGHPLTKFHRKLLGGWFDHECPSDELRLRDNAHVMYDHYIRRYYISLLEKLLLSRRQALESASSMPEEAVSSGSQQPLDYRSIEKQIRHHRLKARAAKRARILLAECKESEHLSSDDEDLAECSAKVAIASAGKCTLSVGDSKDLHMHQPMDTLEVKEMLEQYQIIKETEPDHPSLEFSSVSLEEVVERAGLEQMAEKVGIAVRKPAVKLEPHKLGALAYKN